MSGENRKYFRMTLDDESDFMYLVYTEYFCCNMKCKEPFLEA